jgi:hypothetical protein
MTIESVRLLFRLHFAPHGAYSTVGLLDYKHLAPGRSRRISVSLVFLVLFRARLAYVAEGFRQFPGRRLVVAVSIRPKQAEPIG